MTALLALLLLSLPALAEEAVLPSQGAAVLADATVTAHCSDVASRGVSEAAAANASVSEAWGQVSRAYEADPQPWLLYWRGVLGQCLGHEERAQEDYEAFLALEESAEAPALARDARRRLRRLTATSSEAPTVAPGLVTLVAGGLTAGIGGVLHGAAFEQGQLQRTDQGWTSALSTEQYTRVVAEWDGANKAGFGLLLGGASAAVVGAVGLAVGGAKPRVSVAAMPTRDGWVLALGGTF